MPATPKTSGRRVRERIKQIPVAFEEIQKSGRLVWTKQVSFVSDVPGKNSADGLDGGGVATDTLIQLIRNAHTSVLIQSPYLVTTEASRKLFKDAVSRGVHVKILTSILASIYSLEAFGCYICERDKLLQ